MNRFLERAMQLGAAFSAAMTLHVLVFSVADLWSWRPAVNAAPPPAAHVDLGVRTKQSLPPRLPGRRLPPPPPPPPVPEVSLNDASTHTPGPLGLRAIRWSEDLGDDGMAFEAALAWLGRHQRFDGGWSAEDFCGHEPCPAGGGEAASQPGATAIALLAFLGDGRTHLRRERRTDPVNNRSLCDGETVKNALKWLIAHSAHDGTKPSPWPPRDLALATLAMVEAFDLTRNEIFHSTAQALLNTIPLSHAGGVRWKTAEGGTVADPEAAAIALMAFGMARDARLRVPEAAMREATFALDADEAETPLLRASLATAARLLSLDPVESAGGPAAFRPGDGDPATLDLRTIHWVLLAARQASPADPAAWRVWRDPGVTRVVEAQRGAASGCLQGSWDPPAGSRMGRVSETAMNALTLLTWKRYVPTPK